MDKYIWTNINIVNSIITTIKWIQIKAIAGAAGTREVEQGIYES